MLALILMKLFFLKLDGRRSAARLHANLLFEAAQRKLLPAARHFSIGAPWSCLSDRGSRLLTNESKSSTVAKTTTTTLTPFPQIHSIDPESETLSKFLLLLSLLFPERFAEGKKKKHVKNLKMKIYFFKIKIPQVILLDFSSSFISFLQILSCLFFAS